MELFLDALLDALIDGVKMLPFLYLAYLLIEWLERHHGESIEGALAGGGRWGFIPGALLGCVPQCGFSAVASNLYASRVITPGTLLAVFIATSDEAIPLLAAEPSQWVTLVLLLACFAFSASAPGNAVRAATLSGGMSAPRAVLQAFYFGVALMGSWFSLPLLVVWALVAWQLSEAIRGCPCRFNHPVWITALSVCLFCAQLAPTLYTGNYLGDGRTLNTYFYTFVLMSCALVLYWLGWAQRRAEDRLPFAAIGTARRDGLRLAAFAAALVLLAVGCVSYRPEGSADWSLWNTASGSAVRSLMTGQAAAYDAAMDARDAAMNDPENTRPVLTPVDDIPSAFMGDALNADNLDYVLSLYAEYYEKQQVTAAEGE